MPIAVACACGAKLKAPDSTAGKRVKCPKCGDPITVPAAEVDYEVVDDDPPPTLARKKPQLVEDDDEPPRPMKTKAKAPVEVDEPVDDDDEEEEDEKPKKKKGGKRRTGKNREEEKKKRMITLILGLCGAVVVLGAAGAVIAFAVNMKDPSKVPAPTQPAPQPPPPSGWKTFKAGGMSAWIPESITLNEKVPEPGEKPTPPLVSAKSWTNLDPKNPPKQIVAVYELEKGQLDQAFVTKFQQNPAAAWEEMLKMRNAETGAAGLKMEMVDTTLAGTSGKEFFMKLPNNTRVTARAIVKGDTMYAAAVLHKDTGGDDALLNNFFDSFRIE